MKRCYLGAAVLLVLMILGILSSRWMARYYGDLENRMLRAAQQIPAEPEAAVAQLRDRWQRGKLLSAILADHQKLDQAEGTLALLSRAAEDRDQAQWRQLCLEIAHIFRILREEQNLSWENIL